MNETERIEMFHKDNAPRYIVSHDNGCYSLCLPPDLLSDEYCPYQQALMLRTVRGCLMQNLQAVDELLDRGVAGIQTAPLNPNLIRIKTAEPGQKFSLHF